MNLTSLRFFSSLIFSGLADKYWGFDNETHALISREAFDRSYLGTTGCRINGA